MKIKDLSAASIERIKKMRYDNFVNKHEGPETWAWKFKNYAPDDMIFRTYPDFDPEKARPEFLEIGEHWALLPISKEHHTQLTVLHHFISEEHRKLVAYLKDTTYGEGIFDSGFVAICDWFEPEGFFLATFYHEWYIVDYDEEARQLYHT